MAAAQELDRDELEAELRPQLEKKFKMGGKDLYINAIQIQAYASGGAGANDPDKRMNIYDEPIRAPETGSSKLLKPLNGIVEELCAKMEFIAHKLGGMTKFVINCRVPGFDKVVFMTIATIFSDDERVVDLDTGLPGGVLAGTERGERAADLRHRETHTRMNINWSKDQMNTVMELNKHLSSEVLRLTAAIARMSAVVESAHSQQVLRDTIIKSAAKKDEMMTSMFSAALANLPIIFQYFAGGGGATINLGESLEVQAIKKMYHALDAELKGEFDTAVTKLVFKLTPAQQHVALKVVESIRKSEMNDRLKEIDEIGSSLPSKKALGQ